MVGYRRKLVQKNLNNAFPERTASELRKIEKEFYRNLCDYAVETLKLITMSQDELKKRLVFKNAEVAFKYFNRNQSVLLLASHQFNWEWLLAAGCFTYPATDFVYQSVSSTFFDAISLTSRTRFGAYAIKRDEVARECIRRNSILRGIAIVADQYPGYGRDKKYQTTFLNQDTVFFFGVNQLAVLTQYPAVYHEIRKVKRGYYEATLVEVGIPPYSRESEVVIANYVKAVEKVIIENPSGWLWSHNRWKTRHLKST